MGWSEAIAVITVILGSHGVLYWRLSKVCSEVRQHNKDLTELRSMVRNVLAGGGRKNE